MARKCAEIVGIKQLEDVLNKLPAKVNRSVLLSTTREAGKGLLQKAKSSLSAANSRQGSPNVNTDEMVQMWSLRKSKTWRAGVAVGFKAQYDNKARGQLFSKYAPDISRQKWAILGPLWMEHGTTGVRRKGGKARKILAHGWFRRSVDTSMRGIENSFKSILHKKLNQFIDRYIRKSGITW